MFAVIHAAPWAWAVLAICWTVGFSLAAYVAFLGLYWWPKKDREKWRVRS